MASGSPMRRTARAVVVALSLAVVATGCSTNGLIFHDSGTLKVDAPRNNSTVNQPVTVRWHLKPGTTPPAHFAVFLDRTPPRPGQPLPAEEDRTGITVTDANSVVLEDIQPTDAISDEDKNRHDVIVVFVDDNDRRQSEVAGFVQFKVRT